MPAYVRPAVEASVFRDDAGQVIPYGDRWDWEAGPPEETYSRESNLERFAPLHTIAGALIDHVVRTFDVAVEEGAQVLTDFTHPPEDEVRAVRLTPRAPRSAPLTLVLTSFPGVRIRAGLFHEVSHPVCGCDACDETWETAADDLERVVLTVVEGRFREALGRGRRPDVRYWMEYPGGSESGTTHRQRMPPEVRAAARARLADVPDWWAPWPRRDADAHPGASARS